GICKHYPKVAKLIREALSLRRYSEAGVPKTDILHRQQEKIEQMKNLISNAIEKIQQNGEKPTVKGIALIMNLHYQALYIYDEVKIFLSEQIDPVKRREAELKDEYKEDIINSIKFALQHIRETKPADYCFRIEEICNLAEISIRSFKLFNEARA